MTDIKISALPNASTITPGDKVIITDADDANSTKQAAVSLLNPFSNITPWQVGNHHIGKLVSSDGAIWLCLQARTNANNAKPLKDRIGWTKAAGALVRQTIRAAAINFPPYLNGNYGNFDLDPGFAFGDYDFLEFCISPVQNHICTTFLVAVARLNGSSSLIPLEYRVSTPGAIQFYRVDNNTIAFTAHSTAAYRIVDIVGIRW